MADLTAAQQAALGQLVAQCPDRVLSQLETAVSAMSGLRAASVRQLITSEIRDRYRRDLVLAPLLPLFRPRMDEMQGLIFPPYLVNALWQAAKRNEPELLAQLDREDDLSRMIADRLCMTAASALRDSGVEIWPTGTLAQKEALARILDVAGIARTTVRRLPEWQGRVQADAVAEMKLAFRQASTIGHDGAQRLMEIYFAHLREGLQILRLANHATALTTPPSSLEGGPFADFVERVIEALARKCDAIVEYDLSEGPNGVMTLRDRLQWLSTALAEIDMVVSPRPDSIWARALRQQKLRVSQFLSGLYQEADKIVTGLLPEERMTLIGRMTRSVPRLVAPIDDAVVEKARLLTGILSVSRGPAATLGCESERRQTVEGLTGRISGWADEALERMNRSEAMDGGQMARRRLQVMIDLLQLAGAKDAARTVRRRLASAGAASGISLRQS